MHCDMSNLFDIFSLLPTSGMPMLTSALNLSDKLSNEILMHKSPHLDNNVTLESASYEIFIDGSSIFTNFNSDINLDSSCLL